jgi:hypothetical protein
MGRKGLAAEIANLSKLDIDERRDRRKAMYGKAPSREIGRSFLTRAIAYRLQERLAADSNSPLADCSSGFLRDHAYANEAAGAGFSVVGAR